MHITIFTLLVAVSVFTFSGCNKSDVASVLTEESVEKIETTMPENVEEKVIDVEEIDETEETVVIKKPEPVQTTTQILQDYTPEIFAQLKGNQKFALYFAADWCSSCRATLKNINDNPEDFEGVTLLEIDYDNSTELKKEFGIVSQHAFVFFDANGEIVSTEYFPQDADVIEFFK